MPTRIASRYQEYRDLRPGHAWGYDSNTRHSRYVTYAVGRTPGGRIFNALLTHSRDEHEPMSWGDILQPSMMHCYAESPSWDYRLDQIYDPSELDPVLVAEAEAAIIAQGWELVHPIGEYTPEQMAEFALVREQREAARLAVEAEFKRIKRMSAVRSDRIR